MAVQQPLPANATGLEKALNWVDARFPATKLWREHLSEYYAPKNFNFWYFFGSLALLVLVIQIVTGIFLVMHYKPDAALAFGSVDFCADSGIRGDGEELFAVRTHLVLHSRLAGIAAPLDGVSLALDDTAQLEADVARARRFGFGGKLCIHPRQVAAVNAGFAPSPAEVDWARRVVAAVASQGLGALRVDGKLVDKPVLLLAESVLAAVRA